jgi:hypothetical protein
MVIGPGRFMSGPALFAIGLAGALAARSDGKLRRLRCNPPLMCMVEGRLQGHGGVW